MHGSIIWALIKKGRWGETLSLTYLQYFNFVTEKDYESMEDNW